MTWTTRRRSRFGPLAAVVAGEGPLVVLIHGVGLRAEAWGAQIEALAETSRVIAVDMPGHGESAALGADAGLADFTDAIVTGFDQPAVVIGHSFGAMIALDMAARYLDQVCGVAALNAIFRRSPEARSAVLARAESLDGQTMADPAKTLARWFGDASSAEQRACRDWLCCVDPGGYRTAYGVFAREDGPRDEALNAISCPALFLTGGQEPNSTPDMSRAMAALTPNGQAEIIDGAAHMLPMTHAEQVNATLTTFIANAMNAPVEEGRN